MKSLPMVAACLTATLLSACAPVQQTTPTSPGSTGTASPRLPNPSLNARGNIPKQVGETASIIDSKTGQVVADWKITLIDNAFTCLTAGSKPAKNGHYIALSIELVSGPGLESLGPQQTFSLNPAYFSLMSPNGAVQPDAAGNAGTCIDATYRLPAVATDQKATGLIVLDASEPHGFVIYRPIGADGGWEWSF